jgi:3-hydroxyisobutyrate dehydrogenase-like beta-hydroxyacid dehydrogenase
MIDAPRNHLQHSHEHYCSGEHQMRRIGLLHPGAMGASIGAAARSNQYTVLWASAGRTASTHARARRANLEDAGTMAELLKASEIVLSVCPPHAAEDVASEVAQLGFSGVYAECNAVSPDRTRAIQRIVEGGGAHYVDGGIIGGPAWTREAKTHLYLSGPRAKEVADCFVGSPLQSSVISDRIGAASALKMGYAAYTKGTTALLTAILGMVEKEGVRAELARQWGDAFTDQAVRRVCANTAKAWRFVGEMQEIAATFKGAGLPGGFHQAAADVFERLEEFKDHTEPPAIETVLEALLKDDWGRRPETSLTRHDAENLVHSRRALPSSRPERGKRC